MQININMNVRKHQTSLCTRLTVLVVMARSFSLKEQSSLFSGENSFDPWPSSQRSLGDHDELIRFSSHEESTSEGYDEYFDPPLGSKYECPICLLGLREPVQTICGHRFCRGCIGRFIR